MKADLNKKALIANNLKIELGDVSVSDKLYDT